MATPEHPWQDSNVPSATPPEAADAPLYGVHKYGQKNCPVQAGIRKSCLVRRGTGKNTLVQRSMEKKFNLAWEKFMFRCGMKFTLNRVLRQFYGVQGLLPGLGTILLGPGMILPGLGNILRGPRTITTMDIPLCQGTILPGPFHQVQGIFRWVEGAFCQVQGLFRMVQWPGCRDNSAGCSVQGLNPAQCFPMVQNLSKDFSHFNKIIARFGNFPSKIVCILFIFKLNFLYFRIN